MEFWKEHAKLRVAVIAILFAAGLAALWVYNIPFGRTPKKKP